MMHFFLQNLNSNTLPGTGLLPGARLVLENVKCTFQYHFLSQVTLSPVNALELQM